MEKTIRQLEAWKNDAQYKMFNNTYYAGQYVAFFKALELVKKANKGDKKHD